MESAQDLVMNIIHAVRRERRPETWLAAKMVAKGTAQNVRKIVDVTEDGIPVEHTVETDELIRLFNAQPVQRFGPHSRPSGGKFGNTRRKHR